MGVILAKAPPAPTKAPPVPSTVAAVERPATSGFAVCEEPTPAPPVPSTAAAVERPATSGFAVCEEPDLCTPPTSAVSATCPAAERDVPMPPPPGSATAPCAAQREVPEGTAPPSPLLPPEPIAPWFPDRAVPPARLPRQEMREALLRFVGEVCVHHTYHTRAFYQDLSFGSLAPWKAYVQALPPSEQDAVVGQWGLISFAVQSFPDEWDHNTHGPRVDFVARQADGHTVVRLHPGSSHASDATLCTIAAPSEAVHQRRRALQKRMGGTR